VGIRTNEFPTTGSPQYGYESNENSDSDILSDQGEVELALKTKVDDFKLVCPMSAESKIH